MSVADTSRAHRGTIFAEDARVVAHDAHAGDQYILRVYAPECASTAVAGSFAHIRCDADIPMRRPLSIMRADPKSGEIDFLYKTVGAGLTALSRARKGDTLSMLGPIGNGFSPDASRRRKLMLGGGVGIPPMVFLAEQMRREGTDLADSLVVMGSEVPFPFSPSPSAIQVLGMPTDASNAMPELESLGIPTRLASLQGYDGALQGYVTDVGRLWLDGIGGEALPDVEIFACGPEPMLEAAAALAAEYELPCQLCLEEYMACAVGGCAGCAVPVFTDDGMSMKRVCVDGPVFEAATIYPA